MCGIAGCIDLYSGDNHAPDVERMLRKLVHRGPDGGGVVQRQAMTLGHRRLSIIDLANGVQPMANEHDDVWLTFNGEIYDFENLRKSLESRGHRFRSLSDSETIVHAYEEYGESCTEVLRGQFAFAVWDAKRQTLFMARDRLGQKPVFYYYQSGFFAFASTVAALVEHPRVPRELNQTAVQAYLQMSYVPEGMCIYKDVHKLPPGHSVTFDPTGVQVRRYWSVPLERNKDISLAEATEELHALLVDSTRMRMVADVPYGAFLSGGIDSSLVVAAMRQSTNADIHTFSIGFEEQKYDERPYARQIAQRFETNHREFVVTPQAAVDLPKIASFFDEPFADSSAFAVYYLSELTKRYVTVALNGDGGDESFAGYDRYWGFKNFAHLQRAPKVLVTPFMTLAGLVHRYGFSKNQLLRRLAEWQPLLQLSPGEIYQRTVALPAEHRATIFPDFYQGEDWSEIAQIVDSHPELGSLDRAMLADQQTYLPGDLLVKVDRMTMAHGVEGRSPFLDHRLVEFAAQLPPKVKHGCGPKHLLKRLLLECMPDSFVNRPKQGFGVPIADWFRSDLKNQLNDWIEGSTLVKDRVVELESLRQLRDDHWACVHDHSRALWTFVNLELWYATRA